MSKLERKWWFSIPVSVLAALATLYLTEGAGLPPLGRMNGYQAVLFCLAAGTLWKAISFTLWLAVLCWRPAMATQR